MMNDKNIIEEALKLVNEDRAVILPVNGRSMLPFIIGGKDSVILQPPEDLMLGDVVLAWVEDCRYVIHRIISIDGEAVTLMGDGNIKGTEHCRLSDIKALVTHVQTARGRRFYLYTWWCKLAAKLWFRLRPVRRFILPIFRLL